MVAIEKLEDSKQMKIYMRNESIRNVVDSTQELMLLDEQDNFKQHMLDFFKITNIFDAKRNQSFKETIPELYQLLREAPK